MLRLIVMSTNLEYRERERQRKRESRRQASEARRGKERQRARDKKDEAEFRWNNNMTHALPPCLTGALFS